MRAVRHCISLLLGSLLVEMLLLSPGEVLAFSYTPSSLSFSATTGGAAPPSQTITIDKKTLVARQWTATPNASWMTVAPTAGTISTEMDTITVQVNTGGLAAGSHTSSIRIVLTGTNRHTQTATVPITVVVTNGTTSAPSIALNPTALSFSGTAGGTNPSSKTVNLSNPTGGTLTWSLAESASWLTLNVANGTTTSETDQIVASVTVQGLAAGTCSTMINVTAAGASNSPLAKSP